jgi:hypothetical protein
VLTSKLRPNHKSQQPPSGGFFVTARRRPFTTPIVRPGMAGSRYQHHPTPDAGSSRPCDRTRYSAHTAAAGRSTFQDPTGSGRRRKQAARNAHTCRSRPTPTASRAVDRLVSSVLRRFGCCSLSFTVSATTTDLPGST